MSNSFYPGTPAGWTPLSMRIPKADRMTFQEDPNLPRLSKNVETGTAHYVSPQGDNQGDLRWKAMQVATEQAQARNNHAQRYLGMNGENSPATPTNQSHNSSLMTTSSSSSQRSSPIGSSRGSPVRLGSDIRLRNAFANHQRSGYDTEHVPFPEAGVANVERNGKKLPFPEAGLRAQGR